MTESTYARAKRVVNAAEDEDAPEPVRAAAVQAVKAAQRPPRLPPP
ncbi:MAG: hypothetical protein ACR2LF_08490 [Jatrophihabitantaceae bacterium]